MRGWSMSGDGGTQRKSWRGRGNHSRRHDYGRVGGATLSEIVTAFIFASQKTTCYSFIKINESDPWLAKIWCFMYWNYWFCKLGKIMIGRIDQFSRKKFGKILIIILVCWLPRYLHFLIRFLSYHRELKNQKVILEERTTCLQIMKYYPMLTESEAGVRLWDDNTPALVTSMYWWISIFPSVLFLGRPWTWGPWDVYAGWTAP